MDSLTSLQQQVEAARRALRTVAFASSARVHTPLEQLVRAMVVQSDAFSPVVAALQAPSLDALLRVLHALNNAAGTQGRVAASRPGPGLATPGRPARVLTSVARRGEQAEPTSHFVRRPNADVDGVQHPRAPAGVLAAVSNAPARALSAKLPGPPSHQPPLIDLNGGQSSAPNKARARIQDSAAGVQSQLPSAARSAITASQGSASAASLAQRRAQARRALALQPAEGSRAQTLAASAAGVQRALQPLSALPADVAGRTRSGSTGGVPGRAADSARDRHPLGVHLAVNSPPGSAADVAAVNPASAPVTPSASAAPALASIEMPAMRGVEEPSTSAVAHALTNELHEALYRAGVAPLWP